MPETITVDFSDLMGDVATYTAFLRAEVGGALLNSGGDVITETSGTGIFSFTLAETRVASTHYLVRIYSGSSETAANSVFTGRLWPGQTMVDKDGNTPQTGDNFPFGNRTVIRGTVGAGVSSTTSFTPSALSPSGSAPDQFKGRIIVFDNATTTAGLRGQATDITASSAAALPIFTFTALTTTPVSGDLFSIV